MNKELEALMDEKANQNGASATAEIEMAAIPDAPDPGAQYDNWTMSEAEVVEFARDREPLIAKAIQTSTYLQAEVLAWRFKKLVIERDAELEVLRAELAARDDDPKDD